MSTLDTAPLRDPWIDDLLAILKKATDVITGVAQGAAFKQNHLPKKIYKFRCDDEEGYSRANLENDLVWMAHPDSYNDPYDCSFTIDQEKMVREYKYTVTRIRGTLVSAAEEAQIRKNVSDAVERLLKFRKDTKVCSFSSRHDHLLMWGHYAKDHTGFCIEYDLEPLPAHDPIRRNLYPVIYTKDLYDMTGLGVNSVALDTSNFNPLAPLLSVLHKFDGWSYEDEWRLVKFHEDFEPNYARAVPKPSAVYLGSKMEDTKAKEIATICGKKGITVHKMEMAKDKFELIARSYPGP
jgi:hypothetical protein